MGAAKVAITIDGNLLHRIDPLVAHKRIRTAPEEKYRRPRFRMRLGTAVE
jgi:hypothetical protein